MLEIMGVYYVVHTDLSDNTHQKIRESDIQRISQSNF